MLCVGLIQVSDRMFKRLAIVCTALISCIVIFVSHMMLNQQDEHLKSAKRIIRPNVALRQAGLLRVQGPTVATCDAVANTLGGSAIVFAPIGPALSAGGPTKRMLIGGMSDIVWSL